MLTHGRWTALSNPKKESKSKKKARGLTPTQARQWHTRDGARVWSTPKLRHPNMTLYERDGPLQVVLLADYEILAQQLALLSHPTHRKSTDSVAVVA